jgi:signal transduction histidine kinase
MEVTTAGDLPTLNVDPARIREVVSNLMTNALRHTPRDGKVELSAQLAGDQVEVTVHDTGSGIAPDQLDRIFDRFYRSPDSPGSGLGLPIAKSLVEAHGGTTTASSSIGAGTAIRFSLPAVV